MRRKACVVVLAIILIGGLGLAEKASAAFISGYDLVKLYDSYEQQANYLLKNGPKPAALEISNAYKFAGYVLGVFDIAESLLCFEGKYESERIYRISGYYLKSHPSEWDQAGSGLIMKALMEAFPCPKK